MRPAVRRNGARRRASQGTAAKEKHERNVFFFSVSHSRPILFSPNLPRWTSRPRASAQDLARAPLFLLPQQRNKATLAQGRMSTALSSRPLLGKASAPFSVTTTTGTATTTPSSRTNASADSASFSSSAPSYVSTSRILANGTSSQGLWLDRSALAHDIFVGQVRAK